MVLARSTLFLNSRLVITNLGRGSIYRARGRHKWRPYVKILNALALKQVDRVNINRNPFIKNMLVR